MAQEVGLWLAHTYNNDKKDCEAPNQNVEKTANWDASVYFLYIGMCTC